MEMDKAVKGSSKPWTQDELDLLHEMVRDYGHSKWFWKKAWRWGAYLIGLPATAVMVWEPVVRLWKLLKTGL